MWEAGLGRSRLVAVQGSEQVATLRGLATASPPQGVVTFLLTDVEGSRRGCGKMTRPRWRAAISLHDERCERRSIGATGACGRWSRARATASWSPSRARPPGAGLPSSSSAPGAAVACVQRASGPRGAAHAARPAARRRKTTRAGAQPLRPAAGAAPTAARPRSRATYELVAGARCPRGRALRASARTGSRDLARAEEVFELAPPRAPDRLSALCARWTALPQQPAGSSSLASSAASVELARGWRAYSPTHRLRDPDRGRRLWQDPAGPQFASEAG